MAHNFDDCTSYRSYLHFYECSYRLFRQPLHGFHRFLCYRLRRYGQRRTRIFDPEHEKLDRELTIVINGVQESFIATNWYITAAATLLGGALAYFLRGHALKPLRTFTARVEKVQPNNLTDMKITEEVLPEMRQFVKSFNLMLDRLDEGFTAQRQFAGNAAHELRTPLSLMQAQLELFRQSIPRYCRKRLSFSDCYVGRPNE